MHSAFLVLKILLNIYKILEKFLYEKLDHSSTKILSSISV